MNKNIWKWGNCENTVKRKEQIKSILFSKNQAEITVSSKQDTEGKKKGYVETPFTNGFRSV